MKQHHRRNDQFLHQFLIGSAILATVLATLLAGVGQQLRVGPWAAHGPRQAPVVAVAPQVDTAGAAPVEAAVNGATWTGTTAGDGFRALLPGEEAISGAPTVRPRAGIGFLEYLPGELPSTAIPALRANNQAGIREFLVGEESGGPMSWSERESAPLIGPQP